MQHRLFYTTVLVAVLTCSAHVYAAETAAPAASAAAIAPQPLSKALDEFVVRTGMQVVYRSEFAADVQSKGADSGLSPERMLEQLLRGTGLRYEFINANTVAIRKQDQDRVSQVETRNFVLAEGESSPAEQKRAETAAGDAPTAAAQERTADAGRNTGIEEIVVTAQKRQERLQDVPMSISALSGDKLRAENINNAMDLSLVVPSLSVAEAVPGRQMIILRGIFSGRGTSSLTGLYLDEMPVSGVQDGGTAAYPDLRTIDLNRVEVLKGPQGTLFGEGSAGGVVRFITNDPDPSGFGGEVSSQFYDTADGGWSGEVGGVINLPVAKDVFAIRIAGAYENRSGWIDQPTIGREDINDSEVEHVRVKALYAPLPQLRIKGLVEVHRDEGGGTNTVNQTPYEDSNFRQAFDLSRPTDYRSDYDLYNLTATYDLGFAELLGSFSYGKFDNRYTFTELTNENPPWLEIWRQYDGDSSITSHEVRLTSTAAGPFNWTVGAAYKDSDLTIDTNAGADLSLFGGAVRIPGSGPNSLSTGTSESWAAFADLSYELLDNFEIGGGLRYFTDDRANFDLADPALPTLSGSFDKLTYRTYVKYKPSDKVNLYASLATGFRSGGFNAVSSVALGAPADIGPENSKFYELGIKSALFDGRLRLDAALFFGEYTDMQESSFFLSPVDGSLVGILVNGQDAEIPGVEWDVAWAATERLTLTFAGDVTDAEITHMKPGVASRSPYNIGDPVGRVPKYSLSAGADYRFEWSSAVPGFFLLTFNREGKSYYSLRKTAVVLDGFVEAPEKNFLNASLGGTWNDWQLSLFGRNLLDESELLFATASGWGAQARPRTFGISFRKTF